MNEVKVKEKNSILKNIIIILLVLVTLSLTGYIVYTDFIKVNENDQTDCVDSVLDSDSSENNKEVSEKLKEELLALVNINVNEEVGIFGYDDLQSTFLTYSGIINEFSSDVKRNIIAFSVKNQKEFSFEETEQLPNLNLTCGLVYGIKMTDYNNIIKKFGITDNGDDLYREGSDIGNGYLNKYNDYYVYQTCGYTVAYKLRHDEVTFKYDRGSIVLTDKVSLVKVENIKDSLIDGDNGKKIVTYTFNKNDDGYYLYSVYNRAI